LRTGLLVYILNKESWLVTAIAAEQLRFEMADAKFKRVGKTELKAIVT
jgi:hypothetical protein